MWIKNMDKGKSCAALLTDLSKAFDCIVHDFLIAKLIAFLIAFLSSQFAYCPLIWMMFHNRTLNNRINKLQERALRLVHNYNTSSFYELLQK